MKPFDVNPDSGTKCIVNFYNPPRENGFGKGSKTFHTTQVYRFESMANAKCYLEPSLKTIRKASYQGKVFIDNGQFV